MQSETILVSQEAESRDLSPASHEITDFAIHVALAEAVLGSQGTFVASRATLIHWREAKLVSVETVLDSNRVCLVSCEAVIGSQRTLLV